MPARRPAFQCGAGFVVGTLGGIHWGDPSHIAWPALALVLLAAGLLRPSRARGWLCLAAALFLGWALATRPGDRLRADRAQLAAAADTGTRLTVVGEVAGVPRRTRASRGEVCHRFTLTRIELVENGRRTPIPRTALSVHWYGPASPGAAHPLPGERWRLDGRLQWSRQARFAGGVGREQAIRFLLVSRARASAREPPPATGWRAWLEGRRRAAADRLAAGGAVGLMPYGMSIKGEGTVVSNLVYCNNTLRKGWDHSGFGIYLSGSAELVDSVVCSNKIELSNSYNGILPVVQIAGGMMRRTRVVCNYSDVRPWNPNTGAYSGVYITSGLAENCLIASNTLAKAEESHVNNGTRRAAGVYLGGGTLANTTVAGNSSCLAGDVHGVSMSGGTIVNSIIAGNGESEGCAQVAKVANGTDNVLLQSLTAIDTGVTYTLVGDAGALNPAGEGVLIGDPCFRNASNGDYHPTGVSPARRAGSISETVSLDLDGAVRPAGKRSDLGCYVVDSKGMLIILR